MKAGLIEPGVYICVFMRVCECVCFSMMDGQGEITVHGENLLHRLIYGGTSHSMERLLEEDIRRFLKISTP